MMKLDKIRFGMLVSWISRRGNVELDAGDCSDLDNLIDVEVQEAKIVGCIRLHNTLDKLGIK